MKISDIPNKTFADEVKKGYLSICQAEEKIKLVVQFQISSYASESSYKFSQPR